VDLIEEFRHVLVGLRQLAESPVLAVAPIEDSLREAFVAKTVHADRHEVVRVHA
jgi:hypothetical protein